MKFLFAGIFVSCLALMGCSQGDPENEELEKIVHLEEEMGVRRE